MFSPTTHQHVIFNTRFHAASRSNRIDRIWIHEEQLQIRCPCFSHVFDPNILQFVEALQALRGADRRFAEIRTQSKNVDNFILFHRESKYIQFISQSSKMG